MDLSPRVVRLLLLSGAAAVIVAALPYLGGGAPFGDDNSSHLAEILEIARQLRAGETDLWFDGANLGYPLFRAYQPLPALVMGAAVAVLEPLEPLFLFKLSIVLLFASMPAAWYTAARAFGRTRLEALVFGLLSLGMRDFAEFGLSITSVAHTGLYTQAWAMLFFPLALGRLYAYAGTGEGLGVTVLWTACALLSHVFFAFYLALLAAVLVAAARDGARERLTRLARAGAIATAFTAFWLVPFLLSYELQGGLPWRRAGEDGYPLGELAATFLRGGFFDHERLPWITVLVSAGVVVAVRRRSRLFERWVLASLAVTIFLFLGRTNLGALHGWLPFQRDVQAIRYLCGVQLLGALLAAPVVAALLERSAAFLAARPRLVSFSPAYVLPALVVLGGELYLFERLVFARQVLRVFPLSTNGFDQLAAEVRELGGGRILAHRELGTYSHFYLNLLPALSGQPGLISHARGYHDTHSLYFVEQLAFTPHELRLYAVRGLVATLPPPPELELERVWASPKLALHRVKEAHGFFGFVRTPIELRGALREVRPLVAEWAPRLFARGMLPAVPGTGEPDPGAGAALERLLALPPAPLTSTVAAESSGANRYRARVRAAGGDERLLLRVSFDPGWTASAGGSPAPIARVGPNMMAIDVPAGEHEVEVTFRRPLWEKLLFAATLLAALAWAVHQRVMPYFLSRKASRPIRSSSESA